MILLDYQFDWSVVIRNLPQFLMGAEVDIWVAVGGFALAAVVGLGVALLRVSTVRIFQAAAYGYVQVLRGIPLYVFVLWMYFGLANAFSLNLTALQAMVLSLALTGSGYTAEIFRSGIQAIDRGQIEAARSIGLSRRQTYTTVILPQAMRIVVPPLGNTFIGLFKGATIMSVISIPDMVYVAAEINVTYFEPFEAFTVVAVILVATVLVFSIFVYGAERLAHFES
jgi:His/Glu/Gln/Arg/opine family amino acid ABC transporter permease subunit